MYTSKNILVVANHLKLAELEKKVLLDIIVQQLNRDNVLQFVKFSHDRIQQIKSQYYFLGEAVSDEEEF